MKNLLYLVLVSAGLFFAGCDRNDFFDYDDQAPSLPVNVTAVSGDNRVDISWSPNREKDVAGYNVYYSYSYDGKYTLIGSTKDNYFVDYDARNGDTYYYAVTAYDYNNNESELSRDVVYNTPRPEGFNQVIFDYRNFPSMAGYDFSGHAVVKYDDTDNADMFFENYQGQFYLDVYNDSDIQDLGATKNIYDVASAPVSGWATAKSVKAVIGHTYVIWTWDNHYAKVRISNITNERCTFDWAYQTVEGNVSLKKNVNYTRDSKTLLKEFQSRHGNP